MKCADTIAMFTVAWCLIYGCDDDSKTKEMMPLNSKVATTDSGTASNATGVSETEAVEIARRAAIAKGFQLPPDNVLVVELRGSTYRVTWEIRLAKPAPVADYVVRIEVDAQTGKVVSLLGG